MDSKQIITHGKNFHSGIQQKE